MPQPTKKQKIVLVIFAVLLFSVVLADFFLVYTSFQNDGTGRGLSRYWSREQPIPLSQEHEESFVEESLEDSLELYDFEVEFLGRPELVENNFDIFIPDPYLWTEGKELEDIDYRFKTGTVKSGKYVNEKGEEYDLKDYDVYFLFFSNCIRLRVLYSETRETQFIIGYEYNHPSCESPVWHFPFNVMPDETDSEIIYLFSLEEDFREVFGIDYFLEVNKSDLGYRYNASHYLDGYSQYLLNYLDTIEGLILVDSFGDIPVYLNEAGDAYNFVVSSPEGFPRAVEMHYENLLFTDHSFLEWIPITKENGEVVEYKYSPWDPDTCIKNPIYGRTSQGLKIIGEAIDGSSIYVNANLNDSYLENIYTNHYLKESIYVHNQIEEDTETPFTYEQFVEAMPVMYWEAPFGRFLRFVRYDFIQSPGSIGGCSYI